MSHENIYTVSADNYRDLGRQQGIIFGTYLHQLIKKQINWRDKRKCAKKLLRTHEHFFPDYMQEIQGYSETAKIDDLDIFTLMLEDDVDSIPGKDLGCTTIYSKGLKLVGHNEDVAYSDGGKEISILIKRINNLSTVEIYYAGTIGGSAIGVNSFGVIQAIDTLIGYKNYPNGISKAFIARSMLDSRDPRVVFNKFVKERRKSGFCHNIFNYLGGCYYTEFTTDKPCIENIKMDYIHTNHCLSDSSITIENEEAGSLTRFILATQLLERVQNIEDMKQLLLNSSGGPEKGILNSSNVANIIIDIERRELYIRLLREKGKDWQNYSLKELLS